MPPPLNGLSERWAQTRLLGEIFSQTFVREIVTDLMGQRYSGHFAGCDPHVQQKALSESRMGVSLVP